MEAATTIVAVSNENKLGLVAKIKRDKRLADGATYRAKNKDKLLAYNREYFERRKDDVEFVKKQRKSISISKKKRRIENKKGDGAKPIRPYIRQSPTSQVV
jgi:hypothetical protein